ncbi:MAG TPA: hypothetical protein VFJ43_11675, partial [Bacteroidia bacterium]|nr:hypothetical protein [Bacteroidia bacterium]
MDGMVHREVTRQQYDELLNSIIQNPIKIQNKIENCFTENLGAGIDFFKVLITRSEEYFPPRSQNRYLHDIIVAYCNTRITEIPIQIEEINRFNEIQEQKEKETAERIDKNNELLEKYVNASLKDNE